MHDHHSGSGLPYGTAPDPPSDWRSVFVDGTAREFMGRLLDGDPLFIRARAAGFIVRTGFMVNPEALHMRAVARLAFDAQRRMPTESFDLWCDHQLETSCHELIEEQVEEEIRFVPNASSKDGIFYANLSGMLSIEPELGRTVALSLNRLTRQGRQSVAAVGLAGESIETFAKLEGIPVQKAREIFEESIARILSAVNTRRGRLGIQEGPTDAE